MPEHFLVISGRMQQMILQGKDGESIAKAATLEGNRSPIAASDSDSPTPDSGVPPHQDKQQGFMAQQVCLKIQRDLITSSSSSRYLCLAHFI